jgi:Zn-finger nucleic acid-binding protein
MVMQASKTVGCEKCGGVISIVPGQQHYECGYCSSLIQLAEISVDRILPSGTAQCGECPTCEQPLSTGLIEGRRTLYCSNCFGVLLRHADFGGIVNERQARRVGVEPAEPRPIDPAAFQRKLNCPSCQKTMEVHPYYGPGNIVVDSCTECGYMWLDHGELTRVEQASTVRPSNASTWDRESLPAGDSLLSAPAAESVVEEKPRSPVSVLADLVFFGLRGL